MFLDLYCYWWENAPPLPSLTPSMSSFCTLHSKCARKELRRVYTVQPFPGHPPPPPQVQFTFVLIGSGGNGLEACFI